MTINNALTQCTFSARVISPHCVVFDIDLSENLLLTDEALANKCMQEYVDAYDSVNEFTIYIRGTSMSIFVYGVVNGMY